MQQHRRCVTCSPRHHTFTPTHTTCLLHCCCTGAAVAIDSTGWQDVVVWNPHLTMKDSYEQFVCVENAIAQDAVTVKPGENWRATTTFNVVDVK